MLQDCNDLSYIPLRKAIIRDGVRPQIFQSNYANLQHRQGWSFTNASCSILKFMKKVNYNIVCVCVKSWINV